MEFIEGYDIKLKACYIYNQNTRTELFGTISCDEYYPDLLEENEMDESITRDTYSNLKTFYRLDVENECPIGTSLSNAISLDENELTELIKDKYGYITDFKTLEKTPLFPYTLLSKTDVTQDEMTKNLATISSIFFSIKGYIDLCNENEAFFSKQWFEIFLDAKRIYKTDPEAYTEIECVAMDKLYQGQMDFIATKAIDMFKFNRFSDHKHENKKNPAAPLILSLEQKKVSKTMLVVETYKNPAACFYRLLEILVENRLMPKRCQNCGKYFIPDKRSDTFYCTRQAPQDPKKNCKKYGSEKAWKKNMESDEAVELYRKFYQRKQTRAKRNPSEESLLDFENYKTISKQWRADVKAGIRSEADFIVWLKSL